MTSLVKALHAAAVLHGMVMKRSRRAAVVDVWTAVGFRFVAAAASPVGRWPVTLLGGGPLAGHISSNAAS